MGNMKKLCVMAIVLAALIVVGYSCGGAKSDSGSSADTRVKHVAVDPYVVGAKFFEDLDDDGIQDLGEQLSTASDANGLFSFSSPLTTGAFIVLSNTAIGPLHNGISYTGTIKREVTSITESLVASPLTTLLANGWTELEIVDVLTTAGVTGITVTDITKNPMAGIDNLTTITEGGLAKIRSSLAIYSFMAVMDELIAGQGYDITYITFTANAVTTTPALQKMVQAINYCLSPTLLTTIQTQMTAAQTTMRLSPLVPDDATLPEVTVGDVIRASVAVADYLIPYVASAPTTYSLNYTDLSNIGQQLGLNFYLIRNKGNTYIQYGVAYSAIPGALTGILTKDTVLAVEVIP